MRSLPLIRSKRCFYRNRNYISRRSEGEPALISVSSPSRSLFSPVWSPSLFSLPVICAPSFLSLLYFPSKGTRLSLLLVQKPQVPACERVSTLGWVQSISTTEVNKPRKTWLKKTPPLGNSEMYCNTNSLMYRQELEKKKRSRKGTYENGSSASSINFKHLLVKNCWKKSHETVNV